MSKAGSPKNRLGAAANRQERRKLGDRGVKTRYTTEEMQAERGWGIMRATWLLMTMISTGEDVGGEVRDLLGMLGVDLPQPDQDIREWAAGVAAGINERRVESGVPAFDPSDQWSV